MNSKQGKDKNRFLKSKYFYAVVTSLVIAIIGVASVIYNLSKVNSLLPDDNMNTGFYTVTERGTTEFHANMTQTGVPDERDITSETEKKTMTDDLNRPYTGKYLLPLDSNVTKSFSDGKMVLSKTMEDWRVHDGIDVAGNIGDNAVAIQDGVVKDVYEDALWGGVVVIEHGNGLTAKYCGIKSELQKGKDVGQGQVIGTVVEIPAEKADGVHVHLETVINEKSVDPVKALNLMSEAVTE